MKKLKLKRISNQGLFNTLDIEKSSLFLENLQDFLLDIKMVKLNKKDKDCYRFDSKDYDFNTFYYLFNENCETGEMTKRKISEFDDGEMLRYSTKKAEMLIIFLNKKIRIVLYCSEKDRDNIYEALSRFVEMDK